MKKTLVSKIKINEEFKSLFPTEKNYQKIEIKLEKFRIEMQKQINKLIAKWIMFVQFLKEVIDKKLPSKQISKSLKIKVSVVYYYLSILKKKPLEYLQNMEVQIKELTEI